MAIYNYPEKENSIQNSKYPINNHLIFEVSSSLIYFVDASNAKVLLKTTDEGETVSTVTTRTNKNIARAWHDRDNILIYFVDCDFDDTTSYIWTLNTNTEAINEITSVPADIFDIWVYDSDLWYYYFGSGGYGLDTTIIDPDGDGATLEWTPTGGGDHYTQIQIGEGDISNTAEYITSIVEAQTDIFSFPNIDLSTYDSGEIYEIIVKLYGRGNTVTVDGNLTGMTEQTVTFDSADYGWQSAVFSGLSLEDSDVDSLEITVNSSFSFTNTTYVGITAPAQTPGICWDGTYFYLTSLGDEKVFKYNTSFVEQANYSISDTTIPTGIEWDGTYFYVVSRTDEKIYKYNTSFVL